MGDQAWTVNMSILLPAQRSATRVDQTTDAAWYKLLNANYERAETALSEAGFLEVRKSKRFIPALWQRDDLRVALVRTLGSELWRAVQTWEQTESEEVGHVDQS